MQKLSGQLQAIGLRYKSELPSGATSLLMKVSDRRVTVEVYDRTGKKIGDIPNDQTSTALRDTLQNTVSVFNLTRPRWRSRNNLVRKATSSQSMLCGSERIRASSQGRNHYQFARPTESALDSCPQSSKRAASKETLFKVVVLPN